MARQLLSRRIAALAGLAVLLPATSAAPQQQLARAIPNAAAASPSATPAGVLALSFVNDFAGVSQADHTSDVWTGRVGGALTGDLVMALEFLGSPMEAANPIWPVRTRWTLPGPDGAIIADLYGTVNWKTGIMRLSGAVTGGRLKGSEVDVDGRFVDLNGSGTIRILPQPAL